mmetsp:Transcript_15110/g.32766  ORF Transcript_15110/g.32766 Transcript_15110/m.32766 type:complete len:219 (-) Transcript_15110:85-741(-)
MMTVQHGATAAILLFRPSCNAAWRPFTCCNHLYQLNDSHLSCVTAPQEWLSLDACVSTIALAIALRNTIKQRLDQVLVVDEAHGLATGVQAAILRQGDHVLHILADNLGLDLGSPNLAVADDFGDQGANQGLALVCWAAQMLHLVAVAHHGYLHPRSGSHQSCLILPLANPQASKNVGRGGGNHWLSHKANCLSSAGPERSDRGDRPEGEHFSLRLPA